ncbi:MAG: NAD(P)H-dependent oxidoreductase [Oscillospiraceae bacterium]
MKIVVINGTEVKGCTYQMKEAFLEQLRKGNEIEEYYLPKDMPHFCCGCKTCFKESELKCPHAEYTMPIWNAMLSAELLVFTSPTYALRVTGQMKALLDHFACHWMVHRPDEKMFHKKAVVLANAIGPVTNGTLKDIATSLSWLGVSDIKTLGIGLMEGAIWGELSDKRRKIITEKVKKFSMRYIKDDRARKGIKVSAKFAICKMMHQKFITKEGQLSADDQHWVGNGWVRR